MPLYDYKCLKGHVFEGIGEAGKDPAVPCLKCGAPSMKHWRTAPVMRGDYVGYSCPITGDWIEGKAAHEANLRKHNCHVSEPGEMQAEIRRRSDVDKQIDKENDELVDRVVGELASN